MRGEVIKITAMFECNFDGDCHYKSPVNMKSCIGCRYARLTKQTLPEIVKDSTKE